MVCEKLKCMLNFNWHSLQSLMAIFTVQEIENPRQNDTTATSCHLEQNLSLSIFIAVIDSRMVAGGGICCPRRSYRFAKVFGGWVTGRSPK